MATLRIVTPAYMIELPIDNIGTLRTVLSDISCPSLHSMDFDDQIVQLFYGDPDQDHSTVKVFSKYGVESQSYDGPQQATDAFLALAQSAL